MIHEIMLAFMLLAQLWALALGAIHAWRSDYQEATFYIVCAIFFGDALK